MLDLATYGGLFVVALAAATVLPLQSEAMLTALLLGEQGSPAALIAVASLGNILGAVLNWCLGRWIEHFRERRWFPLNSAQLARSTGWYHRYGRWSLLLSWMPVIGDPLTVVAGVLREPLWSFLLIVGIAKTMRYVVLAVLVL